MSLAELRGPAQVQAVVTDRVHVARGFHLGNVIKVATAEGPVVIDTTGGTANAAAALAVPPVVSMTTGPSSVATLITLPRWKPRAT